MSDDEEYDDTALADTMPCSSLRANGRVVIKDRPCRIVEIGKSMTGKHGRTKCHIIGLDIFNGKKYEDIKVLEEDVVVPRVSSKVYSLRSISNDHIMRLEDASGAIKDNFKVPDGPNGQLILRWDPNGDEKLWITILSAMGADGVTAIRSSAD